MVIIPFDIKKESEDIKMTEKELYEAVADILEVTTDELSADMLLEDIDTWDSIAVLSVISIANEKYGRYPMAKEIGQNKTVGDLIAFLGNLEDA